MGNAGSEISVRCRKCCSFQLCKGEDDQREIMSLTREVEQDVINKSVEVHIKNRVTIASLTLMKNPAITFFPNKDKALKIYNQQIQTLDQNLQDKEISLNLKQSYKV